MKIADFQRVLDGEKKTVECYLCSHRCHIKDGRRGICQVRENREGVLYSLVYGKLISQNVDPIEKKPLFHLLPGSLSYSIATVGCNFRCSHCQNYDISQYPRMHEGAVIGTSVTPEQVVTSAQEYGCQSISYTYIEPTIFFEFAYECAQLAHERGIKNVFVSNGYTSSEATKKIAPFLDGNNIDLKAFTDKFYREVCGAKLAPVLETIELMKELGVWVEVTTLVIPGWNDTDSELKEIARFIKGIDPEMPWHVTRFHPTFKMTDRGATPSSALQRARQIGIAEGLKYVFVGNIPGEDGENTICPQCGEKVVERMGFSIMSQNLANGKCGNCGHSIAGVFRKSAP
ncbi:MAG: AmmeMemoRadiSam system radical SAM enzyme [Desulfobacterales bacterium]|nr:AmmeMemoRadiSam system radical SAM enzyme [Desulfobacterales bacterium]